MGVLQGVLLLPGICCWKRQAAALQSIV